VTTQCVCNDKNILHQSRGSQPQRPKSYRVVESYTAIADLAFFAHARAMYIETVVVHGAYAYAGRRHPHTCDLRLAHRARSHHPSVLNKFQSLTQSVYKLQLEVPW
jgi:hypothetical protein